MVFKFLWIISSSYYELKVNLSTSKTNKIFNVISCSVSSKYILLGKSLKIEYLQNILSDTDNFGFVQPTVCSKHGFIL